mmetsp:Transcript_15094/g.34697  ORF Transcript_15094/g.34697 Transcript_15094/m.34697 type:complete len:428 (+) Transcript_15094:1654-2937(+)
MLAADPSCTLVHLRELLELRDSPVEGAQERNLLLVDDRRNFLRRHSDPGVALELGKRLPQHVDDEGGEAGEEASLVLCACRVQVLPCVPHPAAEDAANHVVAPIVAGLSAVSDGDGQGADVVGDDAIRHVDAVGIFLADFARVRPHARPLVDGVEDGSEDVRVVVGHLALQDRRDPLQTHPGVHVLPRQHAQRLVLVAEHLDEDHVPDLEHVGIVHVHEVGRVPAPDAIVVQLSARSAGASVSHLPEVVLHVALEHSLRWEILEPQLPRLVVRRHCSSLVQVPLAVGGVEPVGLEPVDVGEELPGPGRRLLLEVGGEAPVAEHLEESVVVDVLPDVVKVVVLASRADALLGVACSLERCERTLGVNGAHEDGLELVHPCVGEEQGGIVIRDDAVGGPEGMPSVRPSLLILGLEELDEGLANLGYGPF